MTVVELARTRTKLIHRMPTRGDLWVFVERGHIFLRADQVEALAGIPPWSGGELLVDVDEWTVIDGHACYQLETAVARCEAAGSETAASFLAWLTATLADVDDDALDQAQGMPAFIGSYPVDRAARALSEDPEIQIGRNGLFAFMDTAGWISRSDTDWRLEHVARRNGWLTIREVIVPGRGDRLYPQIYVTPDGLTELQRLLTVGRRHSPPAKAAHPTLFD